MGLDIDPCFSCPLDLSWIFSGRSCAPGIFGYGYGISGTAGVCRAICGVAEREISGAWNCLCKNGFLEEEFA